MPDLLELENVGAGYGETVVLESLSMKLAAGQALSILGRNGVGKTTLLNTILGLTTQHSGVIRYKGRDLGRTPSHERARAGLGLVTQERDIFPSLTVDENLRVALRAGEWDAAGVYALFPRLAERKKNMGNQLSGGEQQMLAIGRALIGNPDVLLLDEPFEGLAPVIVDGLVDAFRKLHQTGRMGIVLVEQHAELALELTERAIVLDRGQISWQGPSRELLGDPEQLARLIGLDMAA
ncbi:ABC transporter ATP-binding protein [Eoetvoesiella caeni]|uniref:Branched-chain amino acid transport system ATP-binding protein n=1 Tax=Eoetvoesiella caeni TaxID=645616 RepID=A0A366HHL0_9BURK|nr:ABC transporter ATP-binding protein [Eoetvoesiella caeni]MCI2808126.1 ABC transporter ATP-binding protein [Eoetvoesiella caeni]NYT53872.1 ABC transporter ATP-binding protein [Eoetvoesiella caeni]RBP42049.1 branched-chain amino acid transport system ATP-binding protein [Eoetvoesiella caeni]